MRKKIMYWIGVVVVGHAVKYLLIPAALAAGFVSGPEAVTKASFWLSFALGVVCVVPGVPTIVNAVTEGDMHKLNKCGMVVTFGIILLAR